MHNSLSWFNLQNKWLIRSLFAILFLYLILRAIFVAPLLDELGTLFWYIQTGNILNDNAVLDANNHLLNSFVGHYCYKIFGDHLIVYRLLAVVSFPIYFFSAKKLVRENIKKFQIVIFLALISIHWLFDYFSLSRGYGPSLAFFMLGMSFITPWNQSFKPKYLTVILTSFILCLLSSLSMIIPILLLFGYLIMTFLLHWKQQSKSTKLQVFCISILFLLPTYIIYLYIEKLKNAGALWWGSKSGLWEVTGKSVSQNIYFIDNEIVKYGLATTFIIMVIAFFYHLIKKGIKQYVLELQFWGTGLFFACILSAIFMAHFMDVNYPQDRVAMYLVILLILSFGSLISELKWLKWLLLIFIWFPISFLMKTNLNTTIFSPKDRIHNEFFDKIQKVTSAEDVISADYVAQMCYAYASRNSDTIKMAVLNHSDTLIGEDYRLESCYGTVSDWSGYKCIFSDENTDMKFYKKIKNVQKSLVKDTSIKHLESNQMYIPLMKYKIEKGTNITELKIITKSSISTEIGMLSLGIIQDVSITSGISEDYYATKFDWYFGHKKSYTFNHVRKMFMQGGMDNNLNIYLYNPEMLNIQLNDFQLKIYSLDKSDTLSF